MNIDASVATLYANVGVTDRLDVGVAAPVVALMLDGSRVNTYRGRTFTQATRDALARSASPISSCARSTRCSTRTALGLAAIVDVRLPTGREEDLLGAGSASVKFSGIGSVEQVGPVAAHANVGVSVGGLAREISYGGALSIAASDRVSVIGELLGRWIDSPGHIVPISAPHPGLSGVETIRPDARRLEPASA